MYIFVIYFYCISWHSGCIQRFGLLWLDFRFVRNKFCIILILFFPSSRNTFTIFSHFGYISMMYAWRAKLTTQFLMYCGFLPPPNIKENVNVWECVCVAQDICECQKCSNKEFCFFILFQPMYKLQKGEPKWIRRWNVERWVRVSTENDGNTQHRLSCFLWNATP